MSVLEKILGVYLESLWKEGERLAKLRLLSLSVEVLKGWRTATLFYLYGVVSVVVATAAFFSVLIYGVTSYAMHGSFPVDAFVGIAAAIGLAAIVSLFWFMGEKRWLEAFDIPRHVDALVGPAKKTSDDRLLQMVEKLIDEKLARQESRRGEAQKLQRTRA